MKYWLVVYIMINGAWVSGEELEGWGPVAYESEALCLESKARAEALHEDLRRENPRANDKQFACERRLGDDRG